MSSHPTRKTARHAGARRLVVLSGAAPARAGAVWLVGAGPGDPELLTLKALRVLQAADVVVHDGLVSEAILDLAPATARRICVAKRKSRHSYAQDEINRMLVAFARQGLAVVRLKGGDAFIFGRGGEELEACRAAGVDCHVVPGVTAALAAAASAGAPLTHRGAAQSVTFVTGHARAGAEPDLDWPTLARANQTVVIYMGLSNAAALAARLIAAGRAPATPALIVENASLPTERRLPTTLAALPTAAAGLTGPALLIVGEAMAMAAADTILETGDRRLAPPPPPGKIAGRSPSPAQEGAGEEKQLPPPPVPLNGGGGSARLRAETEGAQGRELIGGVVLMKALTANRLADGEVVFWAAGAWVERFSQAELFDDDAAAEAAEGHAKAQLTLAVDPYLIEVVEADGGLAPLSYRERLRALGPTNKPDHGKQAAGGAEFEILAHAHGAARSTGRLSLIKRK